MTEMIPSGVIGIFHWL